MSLFDSILSGLTKPVGQNLDNNSDDILKAERDLKKAGYFDKDHSEGFITKELDNGIRKFQKDNDLKMDGIMNPDGETERTLQKYVRTPTPKRKPVKPNNFPKIIRKPEVISPTEKGNQLLDLIGKIESSNNYNIIYGGGERPLTNMTIKEIYKLQEKMEANNMASTAIGRYQFKDTTLKEAVKNLGVDENTFFDKKLQDKLARSRLAFRKFEEYKAGKISTEDFIIKLAQEWAALPTNKNNESYYKGIGNNKSLVEYSILKELLER